MVVLYSFLTDCQGMLRQGEAVQEQWRKFGAQLRRLRRQRGMTQEQLAEISGYHATHIANIERGRNLPSLEAVFRLAQALGVSASELIAAAEEPPGPQSTEALRAQIQELLQRCDEEQLSVLLRLIQMLKGI